ACSRGYAEATAEVAGEMERRRRRLLDLIVVDPPASHDAIADLAQAARWALPRQVAALALEPRGHGHLGPLPALPPDVLIDLTRHDPCALVPDPDGPGRAQVIERGLRGWTGAVGPAVPLDRASSSLRWARQALGLAKRGMAPAPAGIVRCAGQLATLAILADEELARTLAAIRLAPLRPLRPVQQGTLSETLLAWLQSGGNAREVARRLHIHPQTARYRLRQLHLLFGDALHEPNARFELEIALRAERLLGPAEEAWRCPGTGAAGLLLAPPERYPPAVVMASVTPTIACPTVSPTAVQEPGTGQDTPNSSVVTAAAGAGTGCSRHLVPSQVSAKPPGGLKSLANSTPTAVQADGAVQDTVLSWLRPWVAGVRLGRNRQAVPFHVSASVSGPSPVLQEE